MECQTEVGDINERDRILRIFGGNTYANLLNNQITSSGDSQRPFEVDGNTFVCSLLTLATSTVPRLEMKGYQP